MAMADTVTSGRRRDDRLALAAILLGAAIALMGIRAPLTLVTGLALGLGGALLAVRGDRPVPAPRLLILALAVAVTAIVAVAIVRFYEEWEVGQRLAEGAAPGFVVVVMRPYARLAAALRSLALFCGLALLFGSALTRVPSSGK
jgi:hypothetical protein